MGQETRPTTKSQTLEAKGDTPSTAMSYCPIFPLDDRRLVSDERSCLLI